MVGDTSHAAAVAEARRQQAEITAAHATAARPVLLDHGRKTPVAVAWLHGYTNCPRQFAELGRQCHARGWNVWIPLAPHHGLADRMTDATARLTAADLAAWGNRAVDVARGLGERVVVGGLSMGGIVSAVVGLRRAEVSLALSLAPALSPLAGPVALNRAAALLLRALPDRMVWWDPKACQSLEGPKHAYYRYSMRGMGEILRLGFAFADAARLLDPAAARFTFVLNDNDEAVRNTLADRVLDRWKRRGVARADAVRLGIGLGLRHDFIDPDQPYARIDVAYPLLLDAIERGLAGRP
jgi:esterase/lipase